MKNKVALVTGSGRGIGKGIAKVLANAGYDLLLHYNTSKEQTLQLADEVGRIGIRVFTVQANLSTYAGVERMFLECHKCVDIIDLMVYNSGVTAGCSFLDMKEETFDLVTAVDWKGCFFSTQFATKWMIETQTKGNVVIITSNQQQMIFPRGSAYGSVKAAALRFTKQAAVELAPYGIRVNAIAPGYTDTKEPRMYINRNKEDTYPFIPLKRWCDPEEIGHSVLFLDSCHAESITGLNLLMDGGACLDSKLMP